MIQSEDFTLENCLFGSATKTKNSDFDKCNYSGYDTGFNLHGIFWLSNGNGFSKNVIIFCVGTNTSLHIYNEKKYILILGKGPTSWFDGTKYTAEKRYAVNFSEQLKKVYIR